jgi:3-deoxy-7-phosphoheptulonate synthase
VLCERGIKAYPSGEYSRYSLDLSVIQALREATFLPVIVDPSHSTGVAAMVEPASRAAVEFGADGLLIEVASSQPSTSPPKCDAAQAIAPEQLRRIVEFAHAHQPRVVQSR